MTTPQLDALRRAAEKAKTFNGNINVSEGSRDWVEFMAMVNPAAILSLIERLEAQEKIIEAARIRVRAGDNDTCSAMLGPYLCTCGHEALRDLVFAYDQSGGK